MVTRNERDQVVQAVVDVEAEVAGRQVDHQTVPGQPPPEAPHSRPVLARHVDENHDGGEDADGAAD